MDYINLVMGNEYIQGKRFMISLGVMLAVFSAILTSLRESFQKHLTDSYKSEEIA
jgi:hypothetical protein